MTPLAPFLIYALLSSSLLSITRAQDRAPHGFAYENPTAFSPSAFEFFLPCAASNCLPLPQVATVASTLAHESQSTVPETGGSRVGASAIAGIVFGFVFVVLLATSVYCGVASRGNNLSGSKCVQLGA